MTWDLSCPDWRDRIRSGRSLMPDLPYVDEERGRRAVAIFDRLRIPDVPGTPLLVDAAGGWFREIVFALHASLDPVTKERMIRELFLLVPKKNAKTTLGAGLMLTSVLINERPRGEFLIVAPTRDVADLAYSQSVGMIALDRGLRNRFRIQEHKKKITLFSSGAWMQVRTFSTDVMTGVKPSGILVDEEHVIAEKAEAGRVMGQIRGGMISQPEAFLLTITTQSEKPPRGVFKADLDNARAIRDGRVQGHTLPILYEFPEEIQKASTVPGELAPWEDARNWAMVLPNAGRSITIERLRQDYQKAKAAGLEELIRWASQHLNVEIGLALRNDRWAGADYWEQQSDPDLSVNEIVTRSDVIVAGIDGGGMDDLLSLTILGRDSVTSEWLQWSKSWAMDCVLQLRKREASQLEDFAKQNDLVIVQEPGEDVEQLSDTLGGVNKSGKLAMVGLDPQGVGLIVDALAERDIDGPRVVGVAQGWTLSGAIKTTERKLADGSLLHCGQPIMAWAVSNAKVEARGNAIIITKQAAGYLKIDPLMSLLNAVVLMSKNPQAKTTMSSFMRRGILSA